MRMCVRWRSTYVRCVLCSCLVFFLSILLLLRLTGFCSEHSIQCFILKIWTIPMSIMVDTVCRVCVCARLSLYESNRNSTLFSFIFVFNKNKNTMCQNVLAVLCEHEAAKRKKTDYYYRAQAKYHRLTETAQEATLYATGVWHAHVQIASLSTIPTVPLPLRTNN